LCLTVRGANPYGYKFSRTGGFDTEHEMLENVRMLLCCLNIGQILDFRVCLVGQSIFSEKLQKSTLFFLQNKTMGYGTIMPTDESGFGRLKAI
jgi:hypothetical protein